MATTLTREQRIELAEHWDKDDYLEVVNTFKGWRPKTFDKLLNRLLRKNGIARSGYDNCLCDEEVEWGDFYLELQYMILDKCEVVCENGIYRLKEDIENA